MTEPEAKNRDPRPQEPEPTDPVSVPQPPPKSQDKPSEMKCQGCVDPRIVAVVQAGAGATAVVVTAKVIAACACVAAGGVLLGWTCFVLAP